MRGRLCLGILAGVIGFGLLNTAARAQSVPIIGQIFSASITVAPSGSSAVFTTPSFGHFILTQFCAFTEMDLDGITSFGFIATVGSSSSFSCDSFNPGFALPPSQVLECVNLTTTASSCSISGILEKY